MLQSRSYKTFKKIVLAMGLDINTYHCAPRGQGIKNVAVNILSNLGYSKPILSNDLRIYLSIYLFICQNSINVEIHRFTINLPIMNYITMRYVGLIQLLV